MDKKHIVSIETLDGTVYTGPTLQAAFDQVRLAAWGYRASATAPALDAEAYMAAVSRRVFEWCKATVRTASVAEFCADMASAGQWNITLDS